MKTSQTPAQKLFQRLWNAAGKGNLDLIDTTLDAGAKINHQGELGRSPLMNAAAQGQVAAVRHLIDKGANMDLRDEQNETAIVYGVKGRRALETRFDLVRTLAEAGAKTSVVDAIGIPLSHSVAKQFTFDQVEQLIGLKLPLTGLSHLNNETFVHALAEVGRFTGEQTAVLVDHALKQGVDLETMNTRRRTALATAAEQDRPAVALVLLERGACLDNVLDLSLREKIEGWAQEHGFSPKPAQPTLPPMAPGRRRRGP